MEEKERTQCDQSFSSVQMNNHFGPKLMPNDELACLLKSRKKSFFWVVKMVVFGLLLSQICQDQFLTKMLVENKFRFLCHRCANGSKFWVVFQKAQSMCSLSQMQSNSSVAFVNSQSLAMTAVGVPKKIDMLLLWPFKD